MSQGGPQGVRRRSHAELIAVFDRETRRMGSMATLHNHAVADYAGLHQTDQECIDLLDWTGPLTAGEIGRHLGLSSGAVTNLIDRLEHGGWVRRQRDADDRRRVYIQLATEPGVDLWPVYRPLAEAINGYRDRLSARDLRVVVEFLEFANQTMADATSHARTLRAARPEGRSGAV
jgi:MarR family transcriptional regulator, organic hydroperoxide resistance regulator